MQILGREFIEAAAREWYFLAAYLASFVLLQTRQHGELFAMHRVIRHALWAASVVTVLRASIAAFVVVRHNGVSFSIVDYALVMLLSGCVLYLLGCMFEKTPESKLVRAESRP